MVNPKPIFEKRYEVKDLTDEEKRSDTKKEMHKKQVNLYMEQYNRIDDNIDKIFACTWGQCTSSLQLVIIGLSKYEDKAATYDMIWLLENLKLATAGIDSKSSNYSNLIEAILTFFTIKQGDMESNNGF